MAWKDLRVGQKAGLAVGLLVLLCVFVGGVAHFGFLNISDRIDKADDANRLIKMAQEIRRHEKNYIIRQSEEARLLVLGNVEDMRRQIQQSRRKFANPVNIEQLDAVNQALEQYATAFEKWSKLDEQQQGFERDLVMQGRQFVAKCEQLRSEQKQQLSGALDEGTSEFLDRLAKADDANRLIKWANAARLQEKNYMLRRDDSALIEAESTIASMLDLTESLTDRFKQDVNREQITALDRAVNGYKDALDSWVESSRLQAEQETAMVVAARKMIEESEALRASQKMRTDATISRSTWMMILGVALSVSVSLGILFGVGRTIVRPIKRASEIAAAVADGDYSSKEVIEQKDEIGQLSKALDAMRQSLDDREKKLIEAQRTLTEELEEARQRVKGPLLGESSAVRALRSQIEDQAALSSTLMLRGPRGCGHEAVARDIHHRSARRTRPFIHVNCALLTLGMDTDAAVDSRDGTGSESNSGRALESSDFSLASKLELASGGTLYLAEVECLPLGLQQQLVEVLVRCDSESEAADGNATRLVTSSSRDLGQESQAGRLLPKLQKLLENATLTIPGLNERKEDIPLLAERFVKQCAQVLGKSVDRISPDSVRKLNEHSWPGNLDELQDVIRRAVASTTKSEIEIDDSLLTGGVFVGSYSLVEQLGAGGMGQVWLARHRLLARDAAVKLIRPDSMSGSQSDGPLVRRFEREARATANLHSPHTVELYDFGCDDNGTFYYVMERLIGLDLDSMVKRWGPLPAERVLHFLKQACSSLAEAHAAGLVHRDIKPANLFAARLGLQYDFLKVLDFGMVKTPGRAETQLTAAGTASGTPAYMAPEAATSSDQVGPSADLYGLGCVAYWLLSGQLVFQADGAVGLIMHHLRTSPSPPSTRCDAPIPEALEQIVMQCLEKDPANRPRSAEELRQRLSEIETPEPWTEPRAMEWWQTHLPDLTASASDPQEPTVTIDVLETKALRP